MTSTFSPQKAQKAQKALASTGSLPSIHFVYEDPLRPSKWTTEYPSALGPPVEDAESAQHAMIVRMKLSADPAKTLDLHSIVVQSIPLKKVLSKVLDGYPGFTFELERLEFLAPFECFVHRWGAMRAMFSELLNDKNAGEAFAHFELLYNTVQKELGSTLQEKEDMLRHGVIKFKLMWTLFEPDCLIYHRPKIEDQDRVYRLKSAKVDESNGKTLYKMESRYVDFDGTEFGYNKETLSVASFAGTKKITELEAYPLALHEDLDGMKSKLIERGRLFEAFKGHHFVNYGGFAIGKESRGQRKFAVNGRVIIDADSHIRMNSKVNLEYMNTSTPNTVKKPTSPAQESDTDEDVVVLPPKTNANMEESSAGKKPTITKNTKSALTDEELLLADSKVRGYSLRDKKWFQFFIDSTHDIVWQGDAFKSLVAPPDQKDLVLAVAQSQIQAHQQDTFDDFIQGKGQGVIMLLAGPPGVGKTLTAEGIAEAMKSPLFTIGAADLGAKTNTVEKHLGEVLDLCTRWKAVLLLDEADVFMEARTKTDLERNKMISVFLRLLEYFSGLMFLTTNRLDEIDSAFESRIHLTLQYSELDKPSRKQVWKSLLEKSARGQDSNVGPFDDSELEKLAKIELNGRQIKNVLKTAGLLAQGKGECLGMGHLETVIGLRKANERK
ncbi:P-loop containing nucleoside triphosphate hydrolase protein [Polyplosphaeria fusca]|uniref:P-loop containing nucleoside triphosphate hydrolase protein n=1 Tax=Polyplosphaeria fusca TaxID=682080 RepID=A0A9P4QIP0_9PLEO|nr:P-loop containing nucleoside triphosphate hydrolase protein [Polyplosphaeria fusca]